MWKFYAYWIVFLASYTLVKINGNFHFPSRGSKEWWANTIIYQVYPRSFKDSNNDGLGDLQGLIQKLDHFVDLNIETLWVGPILKSPMTDMGYDVEDYKMIDPIFGTMEDFDKLISEMNKRDLKLITDFIPNHSSDQCEWFQKSIKRDVKYDKYYIWLDAKNQAEVIKNQSVKPIPPNNWKSVFENSAWTWIDERKQFYFHQFNPHQPDFNLRNPDVHSELLDVIKFWLDKGVSGFRFDAIQHAYENSSMPDEPVLPGRDGSLYSDYAHIYTKDQPENIGLLLEWRKFVEDYIKINNKTKSVLLTSEAYSPMETLLKYYGNETNPGVQVPFNFDFIDIDRNNIVQSIDKAIKHAIEYLPDNAMPNWVIENHDNLRISYKFGNEYVQPLNALNLALPGIDVTYYGSEIGMDITYLRPEQFQDKNIVEIFHRIGQTRDSSRSPMQWDDSINSGFTESKKPWVPVNPNYYELNVEHQKKIPTSNYNFYKKMSNLRKTNTLKYGDLNTYNVSQSIYVLKRSLSKHESYYLVFNFGSETESVVLSSTVSNINDTLTVYLGSANANYTEGSIVYTNSWIDPLVLRPQSVVVLTDKDPNTAADNGSIQNSCTHINIKLIVVLCSLLFTKCLS